VTTQINELQDASIRWMLVPGFLGYIKKNTRFRKSSKKNPDLFQRFTYQRTFGKLKWDTYKRAWNTFETFCNEVLSVVIRLS
jgi:endo-1,4-beta-D-glucanase Y